MSLNLFADMPGNDGYPDKTIHIFGIKNIPKDWSIYASEKYDSDMKLLIQKDTEIEFSGNRGAPNAIILWAYNNKTGAQTPKYYLYNNSYDENDSVVINLLNIQKDSLILEEKIISTFLSFGGKWGIDNNSPNKSNSQKTSNDTPRIEIEQGKDKIINPTNSAEPVVNNEIEHVKFSPKGNNQELILIGLALLSFAFIGWIYIRKRRKD